MTGGKKFIPNPNKLTLKEQSFINNPVVIGIAEKEKYKGRMISMSDSFFNQLNIYLKENPTEGNRSGFIVRVVAEYMERKKNKTVY